SPPRVASRAGYFVPPPTRRSPDLWAARHALQGWASARDTADAARPAAQRAASAATETPWYVTVLRVGLLVPVVLLLGVWVALALDRKSTRLNSSHVKISYAVFCLK